MARKNPRKTKKNPVKRILKKVDAKTTSAIAKAKKSTRFQFNPQKFNLVLRSLFLFIILFVICLVLYGITSNIFWNNFFFLFMMIFVFISVALLIAFLILTFYRVLKR